MIAALLPIFNRWWRVGAAVALVAAGWQVNQWRWEAKQDRAIAEARAEVRAECKQVQKTTEEVSHDYQTQINAINARHTAALRRVRADATKQCVRVATAPGGRDDAAAGDGLQGQTAIAAGDLLELARVADLQTAQLQACQEFIRKTWAAQ
jgi:hypothetical protein